MATRKSTPRRRRGALRPSPTPGIKSSANVHRLTVRPHYPASRAAFISMRPDPPAMPLLHLQGRWLDRAGFAIGTTVRVSVSPGRLILEVADAEGATEGAATTQCGHVVNLVSVRSP
ncbi:MAG: SymE family type I addiction module toxin [Pseudomonadota bacterium]|nr:SymE family type I addiction module toxin [Pseudomonadota bacterium]